MSSVHDTDLSDSISIISTIESEDASSDFELVDFDDDPRPQPPSSTHSIAPSVVSDDQSAPPSPALHESRFHFPDPAAIFSEANLDSSSICTIASPAQPDPFSLPPPAQRVQVEAKSFEPESIKPEPFEPEPFEPEPFEPTTPKVEQLRHGIQATSLQAAPDRAQTSHDPFFGESKRSRASLLHLRRTALASPKTTCLLMLLAAVLLGVPFHSNSLLLAGARPHPDQCYAVPIHGQIRHSSCTGPFQLARGLSASTLARQAPRRSAFNLGARIHRNRQRQALQVQARLHRAAATRDHPESFDPRSTSAQWIECQSILQWCL